jgi:hypothetical protein
MDVPLAPTIDAAESVSAAVTVALRRRAGDCLATACRASIG